MKTRKGISVPDDLGHALEESELLTTFERMRPSCHRDYGDWVAESKNPEVRKRRVKSVLKKVTDWGERHPQKASEQLEPDNREPEYQRFEAKIYKIGINPCVDVRWYRNNSDKVLEKFSNSIVTD